MSDTLNYTAEDMIAFLKWQPLNKKLELSSLSNKSLSRVEYTRAFWAIHDKTPAEWLLDFNKIKN